jgi:membrane-associated protease RseP (regulator of RpoE activity)
VNNNVRVNITVGVGEVVDGSPAERNGLKPVDKIVRIDGKTIAGDNCDEIARGLEAGDTVRLRVQSGEREREVVIIAAQRPADFPIVMRRIDRDFNFPFDTAFRRMIITMDTLHGDSLFIRRFGSMGDSLFFNNFRGLRGMRLDTMGGGAFWYSDSLPGGMRLRMMRGDGPGDGPFFFERFESAGRNSVAGASFLEMNPGLAQYFNTDRGLLLTDVSPGTPAARAGLESGDVVLRIDGQSVETVDDVRDLVRRSTRPLRFEVMRKGRTRTLEVDARASIRRVP